MEEVLDVYEQPYDPDKPVICFDEQPCQLIGDVLAPIPMKPGQVQRQDYHYQRNGTCVILMAFEPLAGKRIVEVKERKTKKDYAEFMKNLLEKHYRHTDGIIVVQDNLNTHNPSSFYETFPPEEAFELSRRIKMAYTPKKASWLNMAEIEFSVLGKQCLDRRIGNIENLCREVFVLVKKRNQQKATVNWQFTKNIARNKLVKWYETIRN